jgi:hypothetical protein
MRNDYGTRPYISRFSGKTAKSTPKKQNANDRLDESLGARDGKESTKTQSFKDRRDESRS